MSPAQNHTRSGDPDSVAAEIRREEQRKRLILLGLAALAGAAAVVAFLLSPGQSAETGMSETGHILVLAAWLVICVAFAFNRFRPRAPYDSETAMRPRSEMFQAKRWRLLFTISLFVAVVLVPLSAIESLRPIAGGSAWDRLYFAVLLLGPCGLLIGVMTGGAYSRAVGAAVDDELTDAHRASAFRTGFGMFAASGFAAYVTALFRPDWAIATLPAVLGLGLAAAGLRFALLERAAGQDG